MKKLVIILKPVVIFVLIILYIAYFGIDSLNRYKWGNLVTETYIQYDRKPPPVIILMSKMFWRNGTSGTALRQPGDMEPLCKGKEGEELKSCLENLSADDVEIVGPLANHTETYEKRYIYSPDVISEITQTISTVL